MVYPTGFLPFDQTLLKPYNHIFVRLPTGVRTL